MATPLYKYTQVPKTLTTSYEDAYYGAQKQRARREAKLGEAQASYEAGQTTFEDFSNTANRILTGSVGLPERTDVSNLQLAEQEREFSTLDAEQAAAYAQGKLSYDEYKTYLEQTLGRYQDTSAQYLQRQSDLSQLAIDKTFRDIDNLTTEFNTGELQYQDYIGQLQSYLTGYEVGSDQYQSILDYANKANQQSATNQYNSLYDQYSAGQITYQDYLSGVKNIGFQLQTDLTGATSGGSVDDVFITDSSGNQVSVGDALTGITENYNQQQVTQYDDDYAKGKISFETYAEFLKGQLGSYQEGVAQYEELGTMWEDAYKTELDRYYATQQGLFEAGKLKDKEWAQFNKWYKKQVNKGPQQTTEFNTFTYTPKNKGKSKGSKGKGKK